MHCHTRGGHQISDEQQDVKLSSSELQEREAATEGPKGERKNVKRRQCGLQEREAATNGPKGERKSVKRRQGVLQDPLCSHQ